MLADTPLNPKYRRDKTDLLYSTARALTMGNDITAYGHSVSGMNEYSLTRVETIKRTFNNMSVIYPRKHVLRHPRISDYIHTDKTRRMFWEYYSMLRYLGRSRRQILQVIFDELGIDR
jgi:hypothetical protein